MTTTTKPDTFTWTVITALFIGMGTTFLLFSLIYARDFADILSTPEVLWNAVCGRQMPANELLMPLLRGLGTAAIGLGLAVQWLKNRVLSYKLMTS
ncbi:MAG: hypothetical protein KIH69_022945 [Anaerolineae bacterium]|nr:hypothetical protein [Anaerolineae bacterium]